MIFTENEIDYLTTQALGRVATQHPDGTLQNSPVVFAYNPRTETIDISGHRMASSRKFRNVAANGRVAFVVDDLASTRPWRPRFLEIRGWAEAITDEAAPASSPIVPGPFIRIHPTRVLAFGLDDPAEGSPTLNGMPYNARDVAFHPDEKRPETTTEDDPR